MGRDGGRRGLWDVRRVLWDGMTKRRRRRRRRREHNQSQRSKVDFIMDNTSIDK